MCETTAEINGSFISTCSLCKSGLKPYVDPLNPYTGEVSVMQIFRNTRNGHTKFPCGMGDVK
jgi:hypothetical protein